MGDTSVVRNVVLYTKNGTETCLSTYVEVIHNTVLPCFVMEFEKNLCSNDAVEKNSFSNVKHVSKIASQMSKIIAQISTPVQIQWVFKLKMSSQISKNASQMTTVSEKRSLKCRR